MRLHVIVPAALVTVANVWPAPSTAQQIGMGVILLHYDRYDGGPLLGYDISFRFHKPAVFVAWQDAQRSGNGRDNICSGFTAVPCFGEEDVRVHQHIRSVSVGYALSFSGVRWGAALLPEVSWTHSLGSVQGRSSGKTSAFEHRQARGGVGVEVAHRPFRQNRVRAVLSARAASSFKPYYHSTDSYEPPWATGRWTASVHAGLLVSLR